MTAAAAAAAAAAVAKSVKGTHMIRLGQLGAAARGERATVHVSTKWE